MILFCIVACASPWALFVGVTLAFDEYGCDLERLAGKKRTRRARYETPETK